MPRSTKAGRAVNGTGSIRKTTKKSNGKEYTFWQARYSDPATGLQHSITGKDKKEVTQKLIETLNDINHGCYVAPSKQTLGKKQAVGTDDTTDPAFLQQIIGARTITKNDQERQRCAP